MATMGQHAIFLASKGFAVFPLYTIEDGRCSCGLAGCPSPGKHPVGTLVPQGVSNATTDAGTIREWWALYPDANIGLATGDASGVVVIDIDPGHGGEASFEALEARHGPAPDTWSVATGGGGLHFYFAMPPLDVRNSAGSIGPGIDVRGNGGYVVAPPSLHASGEAYRWVPELHPRRVPLAELPEWMLARIVSKAERRVAEALPATIRDGQRNVWLTSAAGTMRRRGFSEAAIFAALSVENRTRCNPPLPDGEVRRIAQSIQRYPPAPTVTIGRRSA